MSLIAWVALDSEQNYRHAILRLANIPNPSNERQSINYRQCYKTLDIYFAQRKWFLNSQASRLEAANYDRCLNFSIDIALPFARKSKDLHSTVSRDKTMGKKMSNRKIILLQHTMVTPISNLPSLAQGICWSSNGIHSFPRHWCKGLEIGTGVN